VVVQPGRLRRLGRALRRHPGASAAGLFLVAVLVVSSMAGWISPYSPLEQDYSQILHGPSASHLLGTDDVGRDILSRLLHGIRVSLVASLFSVAVALGIGLPIGIVAGYAGGRLDRLLMRIVDTILSFPALVLVIGLTVAIGSGVLSTMFAVGIVFAPTIARLVRSRVLSVVGEPYVEAAHLSGASSARVVLRHVLPNSIQPALVQASLLGALALLAEASLSFLGLGVQPPQPSLGVLIARSFRYIDSSPVQMLAPGIALVALAFAFNVVADGLRDALDPRERHGPSTANASSRRAAAADEIVSGEGPGDG